MRFYLVDDDIMVIRILENIIEEAGLGDVIGHSTESDSAIQDIIMKKPDIVLVDMLMPVKDGTRVVADVKAQAEDINFIMISQVSTKNMISKAYTAGIEFYINKPINKIEVVSVIKRVKEKLTLEKNFKIIESMVSGSAVETKPKVKDSQMRNIRMVFSKLGIMGEKGGEDILIICKYMLDNGITNFDFKVKDICDKLSDNPKAMEQRVRRAINKGLINIASVGIEDYMNENFIRYSNSLYDFENVKAEMDYIRGKRDSGGKISVKRFIENILLVSEVSDWSY